MPDRIDDRRLDALLTGAATGVDYPSTPALRGRVVAALASGPSPAPRPTRPFSSAPAWAYAAAVVLALAGALALALPGPRDAVADFFGFVPGQRIEVVPTSTASPAPTAAPTRTPRPTPAARAVARSALEQAMGYQPALPSDAGAPEGLWVVEYGGQPLLIATYEDFDLWQTRGGGFFVKGVPADIVIEQPEVHGADAFWIEPGGHETAFFDAQGNEVRGSRRTVTSNVLIWNSDGTYYRLETELSMQEALAIAETLP